MAVNLYKQTLLPVVSLFTSVSTLLCCALPALLVTLGMGAALAGLVSSAPWLVALSEHKVSVFTIAGLLLCGASIMQWRARQLPCPVEKEKAVLCRRLRKLSWGLLIFSFVIYFLGFFFAFLADKFV